jgi:hypothetical protein
MEVSAPASPVSDRAPTIHRKAKAKNPAAGVQRGQIERIRALIENARINRADSQRFADDHRCEL